MLFFAGIILLTVLPVAILLMVSAYLGSASARAHRYSRTNRGDFVDMGSLSSGSRGEMAAPGEGLVVEGTGAELELVDSTKHSGYSQPMKVGDMSKKNSQFILYWMANPLFGSRSSIPSKKVQFVAAPRSEIQDEVETSVNQMWKVHQSQGDDGEDVEDADKEKGKDRLSIVTSLQSPMAGRRGKIKRATSSAALQDTVVRDSLAI